MFKGFSMKNALKLFGFIAFIAVIGFSMIACDDGSSTSSSINGVWGLSDGYKITVSGSTGVISDLGSWPVRLDASNRGYIRIGGEAFRKLTKTGNLTWSGEILTFSYNTSSPNPITCTNTTWRNCTFTVSADGKTLETYTPGATPATYVTYTRR